MMRAADLVVECLRAEGADRLFCVPGESYLALLDALHGQSAIEVVVCRHEGGAGFMALADAKLTGRPGLVAVSRGPGASNVAVAVHAAEQEGAPMVVLVGQVARHERGRHAFQEVDYGLMFGGLAKGTFEVGHAGQLAETVARAFHLARSGTPGPVVVALPEDMLGDETDGAVTGPLPVATGGPSPDDVGRAMELLSQSRRPLLIVGGMLAAPRGRTALKAAAERHGLPVAPTFKRQELFDNDSPLFAGHLGFKIPRVHVDALLQADLILAVGTRLGDVPSQGYRLPRAPAPEQPLIHVHPDPSVIGRVFKTELPLACDAGAFLEALAAQPATADAAREEWAARLNGVARSLRRYAPQRHPDGIDFGAMVAPIAAHAPRDSIVVTDAGNFSGWVHQIWPWDGRAQALGSAGGAMGLGVPGAVAASLRFPERTVIGFVGDGGLMMTGNELATGIAHGARPKIVVASNGTYGTIRLHQERDYPGRTVGTDLRNPDFAAWGRAFGAKAWTVTTAEQAEVVARDMLAEDGPVVVDVRTSLEAISPFTTITKLRGG